MDTTDDHPLWRDFQHLTMQVQTTLIAPPGAGVNWLGGQLDQGYRRGQSAANSWEADTPWLMLDENSIVIDQGHAVCLANPDLLHVRATGMAKNPQHWGSRRLALGHEAPWITSHVVDFRTEELVSVTVRSEHCWIPKLLEIYKNRMATDYRLRTHYLCELINNKRFAGSIDNMAYVNCMHGICDHLGGMDISATPLSMQYYCDCLSQGWDPCDCACWDSWVQQHADFAQYHLYHSCDYYEQGRAWCGARADRYTAVDYTDLFFGLSRTDQGALADIDLAAVAAYSRSNIDILYRALRIMPQAQRADLRHRVDQLATRLQASEAVHSLEVWEGIEPP